MKTTAFQFVAGLLLLIIGILIGWKLPREQRSTVDNQPAPTRTTLSPKPTRSQSQPSSSRQETTPASPAYAEENSAQIFQLANEWSSSALSISDTHAREQVLNTIRSALNGSDPILIQAALLAFNRLHNLNFDKASFRGSILPHLDSDTPDLLQQAWLALSISGHQPEDLERLRRDAHKPGLIKNASRLLSSWENGDLTGASGNTVVSLLAQSEPDTRKEILRGIWGASFSEELTSQVVELANPEQPGSSDALYFSLSTMSQKSPAVVERLIEYLADPDPNNANRAFWGLGQGVPEESNARLAEVALELVNTRTGNTRNQALDLLARYAQSEQLQTIEALATKNEFTEDQQQTFTEIINQLSRQKSETH